MQHDTTKTLYAYWNRVRAGRLAPRRFEIQPSDIAGILPDTFILERVNGEVARFRLAGTRIAEQFGRDFRGVNFFDLFGSGDRLTLQRQLSVVGRMGPVAVLRITANTVGGHTMMFEAVIMPLVHTGGAVDRYIGAICGLSRPSWLGSVAFVRYTLDDVQLVWPEGNPHAGKEPLVFRAPVPLQHSGARIVRSERRQFRVYEGGRGKSDDDI